MLGLPQSTQLNKPVYKKRIYDKFAGNMTDTRKRSFDADVSRVAVVNELSPATLAVEPGQEVAAIFVVRVTLKAPKVDEHNIALVAKLFGQKMVLLLECGQQFRLGVYEAGSLLTTPWASADELNLKLQGQNLDRIWENLVVQIGALEVATGEDLAARIAAKQARQKLQKEIDRTERLARAERQPRKKHDLVQEKRELERKLEDI